MKTPNTKEFLFASWAIDHKTVVYVIMAIFFILGVSSYFNMPRETFPEINDTKVFVSTIYPGNTAEDIERTVTDPLEEALKGVPNLVEIRSTSSEDFSVIDVEFDENIFGLDSHIEKLSKSYENNQKIPPVLKKECGDCQFKASSEELDSGLLSGYHECWKEALGWADEDFLKPNVLDIWDNRKKDNDIREGRIKFSDFSEEDINPRGSRSNSFCVPDK